MVLLAVPMPRQLVALAMGRVAGVTSSTPLVVLGLSIQELVTAS
jgi:hypothetical protein